MSVGSVDVHVDTLPQHVQQPASDVLLAEGDWDLFLYAPAASSYALEPLCRISGPAVIPHAADVNIDGSVYRLVAAQGRDSRAETALTEASIAAWINGAVAVSQWIAEVPVDEHFVALNAGEQPSCQAGQTAATAKLVLVRVNEGRFRISGPGGAELGPGDEIMLPREVTLVAEVSGSLEVMRLGSVDDEAKLRALSNLWAASLANACAAHHGRVPQESLRLEARQERLAREMQEGVGALAGLLVDAVPVSEKAAAKPATGLAAVFDVVVKALKVSFRPGHGIPEKGPAGVMALAEMAGVRCRRVTLSGQWWRQDSGPMIAFMEEDGAPVALLPDNRGGYLAHAGSGGEGSAVDEEFAGALNPSGFVFYRPLPHKALTDLDLLNFGLGGYRRELGMVVVLAGMTGALGLVFPLASAKLVDTFIPSAQKSQVIQLGIALMLVALVQTLLSLTRALTILRIQDKMDLAIQAAVWDRVLHMPVSFYRRYSVANLAGRVRSCTKIIRIYSAGTVAAILSGGFSLLNFAVLFMFSGTLSLIALVLVALAVGAVMLFRRRSVNIAMNGPSSARNLNTLVLQLIQGVTKLRTTASEARAFAVWAKEHAISEVPTVRNQRLQIIEQVFFRGFDHIAVLVLFATAGYFLFRGNHDNLSAGEFVGFFAAFGGVFHGVLALCETLVGVGSVSGAYHKARPILETLPETESGKIAPGTLSGAIEVKGVSFAYPGGGPVLEDVSFTVKPGDFVVVVGTSGSGKSTLLRLLLGFDRPSAGSILYDEHDLTEIRLRQLRRQFGVVLQDTRLLAGDLLSNIVGDSDATLDAAWEAAAIAALEGDIHAMPMGMHTGVNEGGTTLSSGQRQRVLIARAVVGRPRVLFFDEATNVLDGAAQAKVTANLQRLRATRIMIGLRTGALADADLIIVLDAGRIVQSGRYDELMSQPGIFADLLAGEVQ